MEPFLFLLVVRSSRVESAFRGRGSLCDGSPSSICSVKGVDGASESEESGDMAKDSAEERVDKTNDRLLPGRDSPLRNESDLGSMGIGLSGCDVLHVGIEV